MSANTTPIFVGTPRIASVEVTAASNRDGTGTIYQLLVPGTNGSRIEKINCILSGTLSSASTAMAVRVFICDAVGVNPRIFRETVIASTTPSATVVGGNATFTFAGGLVIGTSSTIYVGQSSGDTTVNRGHWTAEAGDF